MSSISDTAQRNTAGAEDGSTRPVQAAIAARRTARRFGPESVARETIQRLLRSAVQAPNHRRTLPWRFFVLDRRGPVRTRLADLAFEAALGRGAAPDSPETRSRAEAKRTEILETPLLLFVFSAPGRSDEETRENYATTACAVENLMLAAGEEGLATGWSTGGIARHPLLRQTIGADAAWDLVAVVYAGYPDPSATAEAPTRPGPEPFTTWLSD